MKILRGGLLFLTLFGIFFIALNIKFSVNRKWLHLCQNTEILRLDLVTPKGKLTLTRRPDLDWQVQSGDESEIGDYKVSNIFTNLLCNIAYVEKFPQEQKLSEEEMQAFGFAHPRGQITINAKDTIVIIAGKDTPAGTEFYLMNANDPKTVYTVANNFFTKLFPVFLELYPRVPFLNLDEELGQELKVIFGDVEVHLTKTGKTWTTDSPLLKEEKTKKLIDALKTFRYSNFKDKDSLADEDLAFYGFDYPDVIFEWRRQGSEGPVKIFKMAVVNGQNYLSTEFNHETHLLILENKAPNLFISFLQELAQKQ